MLDFIRTLFEAFQSLLHIDVTLNNWAGQIGAWLYLILFLIVFSETGLVVAPFLPGDSLLFAVGALSASSPHFDIKILIPLLFAASVLGDSTNYVIGRKFGRVLFQREHRFSFLFKKQYLIRTEQFYMEKGAIAVSISRFLPILRTFAPFVGGLTKMPYLKFLGLSMLGSFFWVNIFCLAGYFFGNIPFIQKNFTLLVMGIIGFSLAPLLIAFIKTQWKR